MSIAARLLEVRQRIEQAARRSGREGGSVRLVAVTKQVAAESIRQAAEAGVRSIGENYVQEARAKRALLEDLELEWRLIGRLQSNKAKIAGSLFDAVETIDRVEVANALVKARGAAPGPLPVLIQVWLGGGDHRPGVRPEKLPELIVDLREQTGVSLRGLMGVPGTEEEPRRGFARLRQLFEDEWKNGGPGWDTLSMGMSGDFETAIEEGSTSVRIGTAIFGQRTAAQPA